MAASIIQPLLAPGVLALGGSILAIVGAAAVRSGPERPLTRPALAVLGLIVLALAGSMLAFWPEGAPRSLPKLIADPLAHVTVALAILGAILSLLVAYHQPRIQITGEFFAMILFAAAGLAMVGLASDLLVLLLAVELTSIPGYVLVALSRKHPLTEEAGAKYFFLGALATCLIAYGFIFIYGATGSFDLLQLPAAQNQWLAIGLILAFAGLAFKITAVPFYFYAPDVYQGAASSATAIIAFLPKVAGFIAILRIVSFIGFDHAVWQAFWPVLWVTALATVTAGNVLALLQSNVKRVLAYSSVAHSGYMLIGLTAAAGTVGGFQNGLAAVLFYVMIYGLMSLGAFGVLGYLAFLAKGRADEPATYKDLAGLARVRPGAALLLAIFILSLTGLPPTAGFWAKVYVFSAALTAREYWLILLAVLGLINAAVAAAYYFRILAWMYIRPPEPAETPSASPESEPWVLVPLGLILTAGLILYFGLLPARLMHLCEVTASTLLK